MSREKEISNATVHTYISEMYRTIKIAQIVFAMSRIVIEISQRDKTQMQAYQ